MHMVQNCRIFLIFFNKKYDTNVLFLQKNKFMETLNKNWFAFTLIAVIFGTIGFLLGNQNKSHNCPMMKGHHKMMSMDDKMNIGKSMFMLKDFKDGDIEWIEDIDIHKEEGEDGEKKIQVRVKAKKD